MRLIDKPLALTASIMIAATGLMATTALAKSTLVYGMQQEPTTLDPTSDATASIDAIVSHNILESLTTVNESGEVRPDLAESWTISDDGLTYRFNLLHGVKYHDGTDFDANDVKFAFDRAMAKDSVNPTKGIFKPVESVTVIDPYTVEIVLKNKDAFFLFNVAQGDASIVAPESVENNKTNPIGTGPFRFDSWTRGDRLKLTKSPDFRDADKVALESVEYRFIAEPAAASAALMAGELDAFPGFPAPEMLPQFEADPRFKVIVGSTEGEVILAMNNAKPPFDNLKVRQAVSYAINRAEIIDGAMYGRATPIGSFYPPHGTAYIDLLDYYKHDTAKAKAMFEEAGVAGSTMTIRVPPFPYAMRSAEIIQAELVAARQERRYTRITSPVRAQVRERLQNAGDLASAGTPILRLDVLGVMDLEIFVPSSRINGIDMGQDVDVYLQSNDTPLQGQVGSVVYSADSVTRSCKIKITLPNEGHLTPGQFGRAHLILGQSSVILVPVASVTERAGIEGVFVSDEAGVTRFRSVRLGRAWQDKREVLAGIEAGVRVVLEPPVRLRDGDRIKRTVTNGD